MILDDIGRTMRGMFGRRGPGAGAAGGGAARGERRARVAEGHVLKPAAGMGLPPAGGNRRTAWPRSGGSRPVQSALATSPTIRSTMGGLTGHDESLIRQLGQGERAAARALLRVHAPEHPPPASRGLSTDRSMPGISVACAAFASRSWSFGSTISTVASFGSEGQVAGLLLQHDRADEPHVALDDAALGIDDERRRQRDHARETPA